MRSWRLLALTALFAFNIYPATSEADIAGIFDDRAGFGDRDDGTEDMLRHLRRPAAANTPAAVFDAAAFPIRRFSLACPGANPMSWTARPSADRGPPGGHTRQQNSPSPAPATFQPDLTRYPAFATARIRHLASLELPPHGADPTLPHAPAAS